MTVALRAIAERPEHAAVVLLEGGAIGLHSGVVFEQGCGGHQYIHLAWHLDLCCDPVPADGAWWVVPAVDRDALEDVATMCATFAKRHADGRVPYALDRADARVTPGGQLVLGSSYGLTCASLVAVLFEAAGAPLVDMTSWHRDRTADRIAEDIDVQRRVVEFLRKNHRDQASVISNSIGCTRLRPEEVAAASGMPTRPVLLPEVEAAAREILETIARAVDAPSP